MRAFRVETHLLELALKRARREKHEGLPSAGHGSGSLDATADLQANQCPLPPPCPGISGCSTYLFPRLGSLISFLLSFCGHRMLGIFRSDPRH